MVDAIYSYVFAAGFFVLLLGAMLYITFSTHGIEEEDAGESVVRGLDATEDDEEATEEAPAETVDEDDEDDEDDEEE